MLSLDLTKRPPRTCRTEIDGIPFVARAIDKARAELPGGNLGVFFSVHSTVSTMSALFYHRFGITHERFVSLVSETANDDAVVAWLRTHADSVSIEKFTKQVLSMQLRDLPDATLAAVQEMYPDANGADPSTLMIDVIDRDDAAMFA